MPTADRSKAALWILRSALVYLLVTVCWLVYRSKDPTTFHPPAAPAGATYSERDIQRLLRIAMVPGGRYPYRAIQKWTSEITIRLAGEFDPHDARAVGAAVQQIRDSVPSLQLREVEKGDESLAIHVVSQDRFSAIHPDADPSHESFVWIWRGADGSIQEGLILVNKNLPPAQRGLDIYRGLLRTLGLLGGAPDWSDSLFGRESELDASGYPQTDLRLLEMLYRPELEPGSDRRHAWSTLRGV